MRASARRAAGLLCAAVGCASPTKDSTAPPPPVPSETGGEHSELPTDTERPPDTGTTEPPQDLFVPYYLAFEMSSGYDSAAREWRAATVDGVEFSPVVALIVYDERGLSGDPAYRCNVVYTFDTAPLSEWIDGTTAILGLSVPPDAEVTTDCGTANAGILDWADDLGGDDPRAMFEGVEWAVGISPMSLFFENALRDTIESIGYNWIVDWAPFVMSGGIEFQPGYYYETSYTRVFQLTPELELVLDDEGSAAQYYVEDVIDGPPDGWYEFYAYYVYSGFF